MKRFRRRHTAKDTQHAFHATAPAHPGALQNARTLEWIDAALFVLALDYAQTRNANTEHFKQALPRAARQCNGQTRKRKHCCVCLLRRCWCMLPDTLWCVVLLRAPDSLPHMVRDIERVRLLHRCRIRNCCRRCTATTRTAGTTSCSSTWTQVRAARPIHSSARAARLLSSASCSVQRYSRCRTAYAYTAVWHRAVRTQA